MLETHITASKPQSFNVEAAETGKQRKILRMVENERMGGTVPKWEHPTTPEQKIQHNLENAQYGTPSFANTLAYAAGHVRPHEEEFGFGDLVDMVNPLHHIPVVGHVYRGITGDDIKPIGQIIGGSVFGGVGGAATSLANLISEQETGRGLAGNALNAVSQTLNDIAPFEENPVKENPEQLLAQAQTAGTAANALPGNLLSFVDMKEQNNITIKRANETASTAPVYPNLDKEPLWPREPITEVKLSGLYALSR